MTAYPDPALFTDATCPYCRDARAAGITGCLHHTTPTRIAPLPRRKP